MAAATRDHSVILGLLLERGANLAATDPDGWTAFHCVCACASNRPSCVEVLARAGCDMAAKDKDGRTGKQVAEQYGCTEVLECLARMAKKAAKNKKKRDRKRRQTAQPVGQSGATQLDAEETELEAEDLLLAPAELLARATGADRSSHANRSRSARVLGILGHFLKGLFIKK